MKEFLDRVYLDNTVREYLWAIGVILLILALHRPLARVLATITSRVLRRRWRTFNETRFLDLIVRPLGAFLLVSITIMVLYKLTFPSLLNFTLYKYPLHQIFISLGKIFQIAVFIWLLLRVIDFIASVLEALADKTPDQTDNQLVLFFRDFLKVFIGIMGILMILYFAFNYNVSSLLTGLSLVGAALALALRESLENLIASFVIFFDKPFTTGDNIKVQSINGTVERIGLRSTRVRTADKSYVTVPNKQMVDSILDNVSRRSHIRGELNLFIHQDASPAKLEELLKDIKGFLARKPEVQNSQVLLNDIRNQVYVVFVEYFTPPVEWSRFTALKQELNLHVLHTIERLELRISPEK